MRLPLIFIAKKAFPCYDAGMRIAILGAGALGCYYGALLAEAGHDVAFIARSAWEPMQKNGLRIVDSSGDIFIPTPRVYRTPEECGAVDLVVVSWKSVCNHLLPQCLPPLLHENSDILTLQNGMGNGEALSRLVPSDHVYIGLCFVCCMMDEPAIIRHLDGGTIQVAPFFLSERTFSRAQQLALILSQARISSKAYEHAEQILWTKLTWNIPFNGLCLAHGGISVKDLFSMRGEVDRARSIIEEVCETAKRRGYPLPLDIVNWQMERTANMGAFVPSSAVDYNRQRPVEYDAIWGIPLSKARAAGVETPQWDKLCRDIRERLLL